MFPFLQAEVKPRCTGDQLGLPSFKLDYIPFQYAIAVDELCDVLVSCGLKLFCFHLFEGFLQCADRLGVSLALSSVGADQVLQEIL